MRKIETTKLDKKEKIKKIKKNKSDAQALFEDLYEEIAELKARITFLEKRR